MAGGSDEGEDAPVVPTDPQEIYGSPSQSDADALRSTSASNPGAVATFLWYHPFIGFFCYLARIHYPQDPDTRVARFRRENRRLYQIFLILDFVLMVVAIVGVLWIALKAVWPLPFVDTGHPPPHTGP